MAGSETTRVRRKSGRGLTVAWLGLLVVVLFAGGYALWMLVGTTQSARNQAARLMAGTVPPGSFDWAAMAFDFGPEGRRMLDRLVRTAPTSALRAEARAALAAKDRWQIRGTRREADAAAPIRLIPAGRQS